jgi:hypothetical protein
MLFSSVVSKKWHKTFLEIHEHIYSLKEFNKTLAKIAEDRGQIYQVGPEAFAYFPKQDDTTETKEEPK